jgi:hypothetical protein
VLQIQSQESISEFVDVRTLVIGHDHTLGHVDDRPESKVMERQVPCVVEFERPSDTDIVSAIEAVTWQRDYVRGGGSIVAALILDAVLADLIESGPLATMIPVRVRFGDLPGLRIMAAVHRLALTREAPKVALHLPTLGGTAPRREDESAFAAAVVESLVSHPPVLQASLEQTPQTNEVGRSALLRCALSRLQQDRPVRLREIGCSAGLNLRADQLPGVAALEAGALPPVVDRIGCDLDPVDPTTTEGRIHLSSYVWVDDVERFERLRRALAVAQRIPAVVVRQDAASYVESLTLSDETTTVLWHSAMWPYLVEDQRARILAGIADLGGSASDARSLVHVSWEWSRQAVDPHTSFELAIRSWRGAKDDGRAFILARGGGHGKDPFLVDGAPVELSVEPLAS